MNVFNRIVMILLLLLLIAFVVVLVAWPFPTLALMQQGLSFAEANVNVYTWWGTIGVGVILLIMLLLEIRRPRRKLIKVQKIDGGQAQIRTESIGRRIAWHIDRLADITDVRPHVRAKGGGVEVDLEIVASSDIEVPMKTAEILAVVRDQVEDKMGLRLVKNNVRFRLEEKPPEPHYVQEAAPAWPSTPPATQED